MSYNFSINDLSVSLGDAERQFTLNAGRWAIQSGEVVGLTGPSGTGKTLLLELLGMLRAPDKGTYVAQPSGDSGEKVQQFDQFWGRADAMALCATARARFFGFVPQTGGLLPFLTVAENVEITQIVAEQRDPDWLAYLLNELGLSQIGHLRPGALSIGQRQRVAIARALAHKPFCVIADEPTAALDPENAHAAMRLLIEAAQVGGSATLISSHDYPSLAQFSMRRMGLQITSAPQDRNVVSTLVALEDHAVADQEETQ